MGFMKAVFDIVDEPTGQTYVDLLNFAGSRCESFSLVWRDHFTFERSAYDVKHALKPFLISNLRTDEWPGTKLIRHEAIVRRYRISGETVRVLLAAGSLYSWLQPNLPEDLAFYSASGSVWMASVSHEHVAWFQDPSLLLTEVHAYVPGLKVRSNQR